MNRRHKVINMAILYIILVVLTGCGKSTESSALQEDVVEVEQEPIATPEPTPEPTATPIPTPTPFPEYDINLMMVGDNLMHMGIVATGKQEDGSYNYDFLFEGIEDFLTEAEVKMINQETILGGNQLGFSGYPHFNSPTEVGDAIVDAGFNVVLHSSNHTADKGLKGILNCVDYWRQYPQILVAGIDGKDTVSEGDSTDKIKVLEIEGVTFAILNYTYAPNMGSFPKEYEGHMDMLCDYNPKSRMIDFTTLREEVLVEIAEADKLVDFVVVCPHWGTEYTTTPSKYQEKFARQMTEAGADIIIGTHPHVVQPVEWVEAENGNKSLCYYSLGNYVSTQKQALCMLEAMAWVTIHVDEEGPFIEVEETGVIPLVCHYNAMPVRMESVYILEDYTEEQAASHGIKTYGGVKLRLSDLQKWTNEVFEGQILTSDQILGD
ncbi:MAG: CapA family protein [Lachnospiraceae bacterium]|nr:CapA family protein [Lachnospiraceae bacterium]